MKLKKISEIINIPYNQIPVQQARCVSKLKQLLEKKEPNIWEGLKSL